MNDEQPDVQRIQVDQVAEVEVSDRPFGHRPFRSALLLYALTVMLLWTAYCAGLLVWEIAHHEDHQARWQATLLPGQLAVTALLWRAEDRSLKRRRAAWERQLILVDEEGGRLPVRLNARGVPSGSTVRMDGATLGLLVARERHAHPGRPVTIDLVELCRQPPDGGG